MQSKLLNFLPKLRPGALASTLLILKEYVSIFDRVSKTIDFLRKTQTAFSRKYLVTIYGTKHSRMGQICGRQPFEMKWRFKFFKGCIPQILLGPFLKTLNPYNAFIRPHLDYGDKVYDRALANHPIKALSLFNIANASTVAIKGTSSVRFFFKNNSWKP